MPGKKRKTVRSLKRISLAELKSIVEKKTKEYETRLKRLKTKRAKLQKDLSLLDRSISELAALLTPKATGRKRTHRPRVAPGRASKRARAAAKKKTTVADIAYSILKAKKKPMHQNEIAELIKRRKLYPTKSKSFALGIGVALARDKRFKKTKPATFTLNR